MLKFLVGQQVIEYAKKLQLKGARNVLVSMGSKGAILLDENGCLYTMKISNKEKIISFTPSIPRSSFSILNVTSDSISVGDTPEYIVVTIIYGIGISGSDSRGRFLYAIEPNNIKTIIKRNADDFHLIATFVISIYYSPTRTGAPSVKNC